MIFKFRNQGTLLRICSQQYYRARNCSTVGLRRLNDFASNNPAVRSRGLIIGYRKLGRCSDQVSAFGLGSMAMNTIYGPVDPAEATAAVNAAFDDGMKFTVTSNADELRKKFRFRRRSERWQCWLRPVKCAG